jgi:hypothetical protein
VSKILKQVNLRQACFQPILQSLIWGFLNNPISKQGIYFSTDAAFASTTKLRKMAIMILLPDCAAKNRIIPGRIINRKRIK